MKLKQFAFLSVLMGSIAWADTEPKESLSVQDYQKYKTLLKDGQREIDRNKTLLHPRQIHTLIPELVSSAHVKEDQPSTNEKNKGAVTVNPNNKTSGTSLSVSKPDSPITNNTSKQTKPKTNNAQKSVKTAQSWGFSRDIEVTPSVSHPMLDQDLFGIRIGTQIKVRLIGGATNVQRNMIRFELLEPIMGDHETLPTGTLIFGHPFANKGYDRLQVSVHKGVTPDGVEFSTSGWVRGYDGLDGLIANIVSDGYLLDRSLGAAVRTAGDVALSNVADQNIALASVKSGVSNLQDEKTEETEKTYGRPEFIVQAQTQEATLEINETF